jgi:hypothetical protein
VSLLQPASHVVAARRASQDAKRRGDGFREMGKFMGSLTELAFANRIQSGRRGGGIQLEKSGIP